MKILKFIFKVVFILLPIYGSAVVTYWVYKESGPATTVVLIYLCVANEFNRKFKEEENHGTLSEAETM